MADSFDKRLVDDWNKIVDVILVYVALFIAVLSSFIIDTYKNLKPDPADITNELLNATYHLMFAQSNNISIPVVDTTSFTILDEDDYNRAVICTALLYTALALCTVVSVIALAAKLWLVSYSDRTFNLLVGLPYDRSVKRQQVYNGVLAWRMGAVINTLPLILLIAVIMFGFYVHISASALEPEIGYTVAIVIILGFVSLAITSLAAAFIPECPFYSPFSAIIQLIFEYLGKFLEIWRSNRPQKKNNRWNRRWLWVVLSIATGAAIAYGTLKYSENILPLVFIPLTITFSYAMQEDNKIEIRKPQRYRIPYFTLGGFVIIGSILSAAGYFTSSMEIFIILYSVGMSVLFLVGMVARRLAKSTKKTRDIDAIAWLLNFESTPDKIEPLLKRIGQITIDKDQDGYHYRARLLESLMPLLSSLITSPRTKRLYDNSQPKDLETYVSCLAQLSDFEDDRWSWKFWEPEQKRLLRSLREDAKRHPILKRSLREKLEDLIKDSRSSQNLIDAAQAVLDNYGLEEHRKELRMQQLEVSGDTSSITTLTEPAHAFYEAKNHIRRKKGYDMLNAA